MAVVRDAERNAVRARGREHALARAHVQRHRLLAEHVLAGLRGSHGLLGVPAHGGREVDGVDARIAEHLAPVGVPAAGPMSLGELGGQVRARPGHRRERAPGAVAQRGRDALGRDVARADEAPPNDVRGPAHRFSIRITRWFSLSET